MLSDPVFKKSPFSVGIYGTSWHVAEGDVSSAYRAFSNEKIFGRMGVYVGLKQVRYTFYGKSR